MCPLLWQIYIPLEGASQEKAVVDFQTASLDLKVHDVNGKNYHFCIQKLSKEIVPTASRVIVKPKRIILSLKKADSRNWLDLVKREEKVWWSNLFDPDLFECSLFQHEGCCIWSYVQEREGREFPSHIKYSYLTHFLLNANKTSTCGFLVCADETTIIYGEGRRSNGKPYGFNEGSAANNIWSGLTMIVTSGY